MKVEFPKGRFQPGFGAATLPKDIGADLFLRAAHKQYNNERVIPFDVTPYLNCVGCDLWNMVLVSRPTDSIHDAAKDALAGSVHSYMILLDLLQDEEVLNEEQIAESRTAARLWSEGVVNQRLDKEMRRLYGPGFLDAKPAPRRIRSAFGTVVPLAREVNRGTAEWKT